MKVCANSDLSVTYIIWFIISYHLGSETTFVLSHSIYKLLSGPWYRKAEDNKLGDKIRQNAVFLAMSLFRWYMYNIYTIRPICRYRSTNHYTCTYITVHDTVLTVLTTCIRKSLTGKKKKKEKKRKKRNWKAMKVEHSIVFSKVSSVLTATVICLHVKVSTNGQSCFYTNVTNKTSQLFYFGLNKSITQKSFFF